MKNHGVRFAIAWLALVAFAMGDESRALPDFQVSDASANKLQSADLVKQGKWLLVYVQANCKGCNDVLNTIDSIPGASARLVVIVSGIDPPQMGTFRARFPHLPDALWYVDHEKSAATGLGITGVPVVFGLNGQTISWTMKGIIGNPAESKAILNNWLAK